MISETRIPAEILCEIFHLLRGDEPIALHKLENDSHLIKFPWAVGRVCRRWRTAFLSHPPLWTSLSLNKPSPDPSAAYLAEMNRRSAIYLKRSGKLPLTIAMSMHYNSMMTICKMLISCSDRWRNAVIVFPFTESVIDDALLECRGRMPILESLTIWKLDFFRYRNAFELAPRLTELDLEIGGRIGAEKFPWAQLTKVTLVMPHVANGFASGNELRAFLLELQSVEELRLTMYMKHHPSHATFGLPPVRLTRLRFLKVSAAFRGVFSWLELPLLEHLSLDYEFVYRLETAIRREEIASLIDLVKRSSCRIRQLTLQCWDIKLSRKIMKVLTTVEEMWIIGLAPDLVRDLANSDNRIYLPNMRVLHVECCSGRFGELVMGLSRLLIMRGKESTMAPSSCNIVPLERLLVRVPTNWTYCYESCCRGFCDDSRTLDRALQAMSSWPSFSVTNVRCDQNGKSSLTLDARALAAGTPTDLTFYYADTDTDFEEESYRHQNVLENMYGRG